MNTRVFAERLKKARTDAGLNQSDLAQQLGVGQNAISNYERGSTPKLETAVRIAEILHVSLDWLLGLEPSPSQNDSKIFLDGLLERMKCGMFTAKQDGYTLRLQYDNRFLNSNEQFEYLGEFLADSTDYYKLDAILQKSNIAEGTVQETLSAVRNKIIDNYSFMFDLPDDSTPPDIE